MISWAWNPGHPVFSPHLEWHWAQHPSREASVCTPNCVSLETGVRRVVKEGEPFSSMCCPLLCRVGALSSWSLAGIKGTRLLGCGVGQGNREERHLTSRLRVIRPRTKPPQGVVNIPNREVEYQISWGHCQVWWITIFSFYALAFFNLPLSCHAFHNLTCSLAVCQCGQLPSQMLECLADRFCAWSTFR